MTSISYVANFQGIFISPKMTLRDDKQRPLTCVAIAAGKKVDKGNSFRRNLVSTDHERGGRRRGGGRSRQGQKGGEHVGTRSIDFSAALKFGTDIYSWPQTLISYSSNRFGSLEHNNRSPSLVPVKFL